MNAERKATAASPRYVFDVRDGSGTHLFYFLTQVTSSVLYFNYVIAGAGQYYWVPQGTEDTLFGNDVTLKVKMVWNGSVAELYLNDTLVRSAAYTPPAANWTPASIFDLSRYEYQTYGGFNVSTDVINGFTVNGPGTGIADAVPPSVSFSAPAAASFLKRKCHVERECDGQRGSKQRAFQVDGVNLGAALAGAGPAYSTTWNAGGGTNGPHTLTAIASDAAGNTTTASVTVTVDTTAPTVSFTAPGNGAAVKGVVALVVNATDNIGVAGVQFTVLPH
jgi:hypothetical protein